jgi:hypothetical protein
LGAQRNSSRIDGPEALEAGNVGGEGEFSVADRERGARIDRSQDRVVPGDQGVAIDGNLCPGGRACSEKEKLAAAERIHFHYKFAKRA